jgi:hypothetical protein
MSVSSDSTILSLIQFRHKDVSAGSVGASALASIQMWDATLDRPGVEEATGAAMQYVQSSEHAAKAYFDHNALQGVYANEERYKEFLKAISSYFAAELKRFDVWWSTLGSQQLRQDKLSYNRLKSELERSQRSFREKLHDAKRRESNAQ